MTVRIKSKILPFEKDMVLPQTLRFTHKNELYEVTYRRNSFDGVIHIILKLVKNDETLLTARLAEGGTHDIVKDEDKGWPVFRLYVNELGEDMINIKLFDDDTSIIIEDEE